MCVHEKTLADLRKNLHFRMSTKAHITKGQNLYNGVKTVIGSYKSSYMKDDQLFLELKPFTIDTSHPEIRYEICYNPSVKEHMKNICGIYLRVKLYSIFDKWCDHYSAFSNGSNFVLPHAWRFDENNDGGMCFGRFGGAVDAAVDCGNYGYAIELATAVLKNLNPNSLVCEVYEWGPQ